MEAGVIAARGPRPARRRGRRRRLLTRTVPIAGVAVAAFAAGAVLATAPERAERHLVTRYVTAWEHADYAAMYGMLDPGSRRSTSEPTFVADLRNAAETATLVSLPATHVGSRNGDDIAVRMRLRTRIWGTLAETLEVP